MNRGCEEDKGEVAVQVIIVEAGRSWQLEDKEEEIEDHVRKKESIRYRMRWGEMGH